MRPWRTPGTYGALSTLREWHHSGGSLRSVEIRETCLLELVSTRMQAMCTLMVIQYQCVQLFYAGRRVEWGRRPVGRARHSLHPRANQLQNCLRRPPACQSTVTRIILIWPMRLKQRLSLTTVHLSLKWHVAVLSQNNLGERYVYHIVAYWENVVTRSPSSARFKGPYLPLRTSSSVGCDQWGKQPYSGPAPV